MSRSKVIVNFTWTKTFPCFNSRGNDSSKYRCKTLTWRLSVSQRWRQRMKGNILFLNFHLSFLNVKSIFSRTVSSLGQLSVSTEPSFKIWRKLSYGSFQSPFIQSFFFFSLTSLLPNYSKTSIMFWAQCCWYQLPEN